MVEARKRLPAYKARADFLDMLAKNRVVVVVGETGTLPFFLCQAWPNAFQRERKDYSMCVIPWSKILIVHPDGLHPSSTPIHPRKI